jgi:predicted phosphate transport protein (TIGR00153 family)
MRVLFQDFLSNRGLFFDQLDLAAKNAADMATLLVGVTNTEQVDERDLLYKQVAKMEHWGDNVTHKINLALNRIVFTPLNRNDIHALAAALDDVADMIKETSNRIDLYNITDFNVSIKELAVLIQKASAEIQKAVGVLKLHQSTDTILMACRQVKEYERQADRIYYNAVANLFLNDKDAINLIKYREILHSLETTVNKCKSTADVLEVILINR